MSDEKDKQEAAQFFLKMAETQGVACSTVSDGHTLLFKREWLQNLLDAHPNNDRICIFIKRPDFKQAN
jgi:hypothetical protein